MSKKDLYIKINGELINVSEDVYLTYYRMESRARYLERKDILHGKTLYSNLDTDETLGEEGIPDLNSESVEDAVVRKIMADKLHQCIERLTAEERDLITKIYFQEISEVQLAKEMGLLQQTINYRKQKILKKLLKMMK
ncbi:MAG: sigma-70 family RNA polymerase sigma factor [Massilibacteroides sp.]|nr:sigma-70 family RNA polymerase sigma factor [Massilibacteroides sp.]